MKQEIKHTFQKYCAIDYSPIYEITILQAIKKGSIIRFDPATNSLRFIISSAVAAEGEHAERNTETCPLDKPHAENCNCYK